MLLFSIHFSFGICRRIWFVVVSLLLLHQNRSRYQKNGKMKPTSSCSFWILDNAIELIHGQPSDQVSLLRPKFHYFFHLVQKCTGQSNRKTGREKQAKLNMVFLSWKNDSFSLRNIVQSNKMQGMSSVSLLLSPWYHCHFCVRLELHFLESPFLCGSGLDFADDKSFPERQKIEMGSHYFFKGVCS